LAKGSTNLNNLITGELELGNVHRITSHEVAVENSEDGLVSNDQEVIVLSLQLKNDGLKTNGKVVV
jgi:hypothetical protein